MTQRISILGTESTWVNPELVLYHGTANHFQESILESVDVAFGLRKTDFGRGFYMTTSLAQSRAWAWQTSQKNPGSLPAVIMFSVDRDSIAKLETLCFVRGSQDSEDYWNLVHSCRSLGSHHGRTRKRGWYDVVIGPVARDWRQRDAFPDADQISFHTSRSATLLNSCNRVIMP